MSRLLAILVCVWAGLPASAPAQAQRVTAIDPARSEIAFVAKQMGVPAEGRFKRFVVQVDFDPAKLAASHAQIEIDLSSFDSGVAEVDVEVSKKAWFNTAQFPTATFASSSVRALGGGRYEAAGKMSIKGRTRDVSAPFAVKQVGGAIVFEGVFTLRRLEYGIGEGPWSDTDTVADEVQVRFKLTGANHK